MSYLGVLLSVALSHCSGYVIQGAFIGGLVGFLLSSIAVGALTWRRLPTYWKLRRPAVTLLLATGGGAIAGLVGVYAGVYIGDSYC